MDPSALSEKQKEKVALIAEKSPELYQAYQHKEKLRHILSMKEEPDAAENALNDWIERMEHSEVEEFQDIAEKIARHRQNICNAIRYGRNSARLEAINNCIKLIIC